MINVSVYILALAEKRFGFFRYILNVVTKTICFQSFNKVKKLLEIWKFYMCKQWSHSVDAAGLKSINRYF